MSRRISPSFAADRLFSASRRPEPAARKLLFMRGLLLMMALLVVPGASSALDHSGQIDADETWLAADNPHVVVGSVTVTEGVTLTLEPGVEVRFDSNRRLVVRGALTAQGLPTEPILFTGNGGGSWSDLYFQYGGSGTFDNCIIEQAGTGLYALGSGAISLSNTTIGDCNYGVYASGSSPMSFDSCLFQDNSYGLYALGGSVELASCTFAGNSNYGFRGQGVAPVFVDAGNTFTGNGTGCYIQDVAAIDYTTPVSFTGNTDAGLRLSGCDQPAVDNMVFTGNTGAEGALVFADCGEFILGAGNVIGGSGQENS